MDILPYFATNSRLLCCNRREDEKGTDLLTEIFGVRTKRFKKNTRKIVVRVKKLTNTDFYELRVSVDNEVRVIFLNGFIKKSTKDYEKEIIKAINILRNVL